MRRDWPEAQSLALQEEENLEFHSTTRTALAINCVFKYLERGFSAYVIKM